MSRGRHTLPERPQLEVPMLLAFVALAVAVLVAVWVADDSLAVEIGVTGLVGVIALAVALYLRSAHRGALALWQEAVDRRRDLVQVQRELAEVRGKHVELLLEIRAIRADLAAVTEENTRSLQMASDQRALMAELLVPRQPIPEPMYPSLHLPLVRAAFTADLPTQALPTPQAEDSYPESDQMGGSEPLPPRQLLDLTASEIARLRPAN